MSFLLTPEDCEKLKAAHDAVWHEMEAKEAAGVKFAVPERTYMAKLRQGFPEETSVIERYQEGRREAAERIDPLTCKYYWTYADVEDPYGVWGVRSCVGQELFVYDGADDDPVSVHDLTPEQKDVLHGRIDREHPRRDPKIAAELLARIRAANRESRPIEFDEYEQDWQESSLPEK